MTPQTDDERSTPGLRRWLPIAVGVVLILVLTGFWQRIGHPFLEHDDWDFLLPTEAARRHDMFDRLLWEGRWFNYLWWRGPGHLLSPSAAALIFQVSALVVAARLAWRWAPGWLAAPTAVAVFASPMLADLSLWPATLGVTMLITAVAACTLTRCARQPSTLIAWIVLATLLTFLSYPPATLVVLVILVVELVDRPLRELVRLTAVFVAAYVGSTLVLFSLNAIAFGTFGLEVRPWRHPNALHSLGDLGENTRRVLDRLGEVVSSTTLPIVLGLVALVACLVLPPLRQRGIRLLLVAGVALGLQSGSTLVSGVITPYRSNGWLWLVLVIAIVWVAGEVTAPAVVRVVAVLTLLAIALWGVRYWSGEGNLAQHRREAYQQTEDRLVDLYRQYPGFPVLVVGTEVDWRSDAFLQEAEYLTKKTFHDHGIRMSYCRPPACDLISRPEVGGHAGEGAVVVRSGSSLVLVPATHVR